MSNERLADALEFAKTMRLKEPEPRWQRDRNGDRLDRLKIERTPKTEEATKYAAWLRRQKDFVCAYCRNPVPNTLRARAVDHVRPLSRGGAHAIENLVPACRGCN